MKWCKKSLGQFIGNIEGLSKSEVILFVNLCYVFTQYFLPLLVTIIPQFCFAVYLFSMLCSCALWWFHDFQRQSMWLRLNQSVHSTLWWLGQGQQRPECDPDLVNKIMSVALLELLEEWTVSIAELSTWSTSWMRLGAAAREWSPHREAKLRNQEKDTRCLCM